MKLGVRWEYESPMTERFGRLVNLDVAPDFTAVAPVVATDATGMLTGHRIPTSLLRPDKSGIQPRLGIAWRPVPGSSLVVRAGYGIYRNTNVYQSIATCWRSSRRCRRRSASATPPRNPLTLPKGFVGQTLGIAEHAQHVRGRSGVPRRLRAELAGVAPARPAGVADG